MAKIVFPSVFRHDHPPVKNAYQVYQSQSSFGELLADRVAKVAGSWPFIITQTCVLSVWVVLNVTALIRHWDPYPFILMNLVLSLQAAYTAPLIMISQNRQNKLDHIEANHDYDVNVKAEQELRTVLQHLEAQSQAIAEIHAQIVGLKQVANGEEADE